MALMPFWFAWTLAAPILFIAPWWAYIIGAGCSFGVVWAWRHVDYSALSITPKNLLADAVIYAAIGMAYTLPLAVIATTFDSFLWLFWIPIGALNGLAHWIGFHVAIPEAGLSALKVGNILACIFLLSETGALWLGISLVKYL